MLLVPAARVKYPMYGETGRADIGRRFAPTDWPRCCAGLVMVTIVHLITGLETGGAERMLARLLRRMDPKRFRSVIVSIGGPGTIGPSLVAAGIEVISLRMRRKMPHPFALLRLARTLRDLRPDVLQTWLYHADLFGLLMKRPGQVPHVIWNLRCSDIALSPAAAAVRRVLSWCSPLTDGVIVNSRAGRRFHESIGYRAARWEVIPNGFDTAEYAPDPQARGRIRADLGIGEDAAVIGMPARHHPMKDHATFLAAAANLAAGYPEICFVLVGPGIEPTNAALAKSIAAAGLADRIRLLGERHDMPAVYAAFDIATLSSAWGEGFPNVLGEAMACGVPCVATNCGDACDLIGDAGLVVARRDPDGLAAAWRALIEIGTEGRRALGVKARARIAGEYDLGIIAGRYEALYAELVKRDAALRLARPPASPGRLPPARRPALHRTDSAGS